jgi:DNA-binding NtrC family response regulator
MQDIPLLVAHALQRLRKRQGLRVPHITSEGMEALTRYSWPGNVRELLNILERLAILSSGGPVGPKEISTLLPSAPAQRGGGAPPYLEGDPRSLRVRLEDYERAQIAGALKGAVGTWRRPGADFKPIERTFTAG